MKHSWWMVLALVVGMGLTALTVSKTDTHGDRAASIPKDQGLLLAFDDPPPPRAPGGAKRTTSDTRSTIPPERMRTGPKPGMEDHSAERNLPEVVAANKLTTSFAAIRFTLMKLESDARAQTIAKEIDTLQAEINTVRLHPATSDWAGLQTHMDTVVASLAASPFASDTTVSTALGNYAQIIEEYRVAKTPAEPAAPSAPEP